VTMPRLGPLRWLTTLALVFAVEGCGVRCLLFGGCTEPPRELYRLTLPDTIGGTPDGGRAAPLVGSMAIATYAAPGIYGGAGIVFRRGDVEYNFYPNLEWAVPLGEQLGVVTERVLTRHPVSLERAVFDPPSRRAQTYIWRGTIREFEEVNRGSQVLAAVRIDVRIVRTIDDSIVWSGSSRAEAPAASNNMTGIVRTLSTLADSVVDDLAMRVRRDLSSPSPPSGTPPE
jgi:ABC-type uncharacterized transport system auxiliary subunit